METVKPLIQYLPLYMQGYEEMKKIMDAEQAECNNVYDGLELVWNNQFLFSSTNGGLKRWERMLGITIKHTDTFQERQFRIYALMNQELPYTYRKLEETLSTLCGEHGWSINLQPNDYTIEIKVGVSNHKNVAAIQDILKKMIPANMVVTITLMYNSNELLHEYTHSQLSAYTHEQLRKGII